MKRYKTLAFFLFFFLLYSCNTQKKQEQFDSLTERFLEELALNYWDLNYHFPTSYLEARDTEAWYFAQCATTDSLLLRHASDVVFTDQDTALVITYQNDTLAKIKLPCSCDYTDDIPNGPRAFDSINNLILDDYIQIEENVYVQHLSNSLADELNPILEEMLNRSGYIRIHDVERRYPQYLLIEYISVSDSIHLIKACEKYSYYFYEEIANILKSVLSEFCKDNHISRLVTPINIYLPKGQKKVK